MKITDQMWTWLAANKPAEYAELVKQNVTEVLVLTGGIEGSVWTRLSFPQLQGSWGDAPLDFDCAAATDHLCLVLVGKPFGDHRDPASMPSDQKPKLKGLFRDDPATPEGKYLVKRRDGSVPVWPHFVLAAADPHAPHALRAYATKISMDPDCEPELAARIFKLADEFEEWRKEHGAGDPTRGRHRVDDPATVEEMKKGKSA